MCVRLTRHTNCEDGAGTSGVKIAQSGTSAPPRPQTETPSQTGSEWFTLSSGQGHTGCVSPCAPGRQRARRPLSISVVLRTHLPLYVHHPSLVLHIHLKSTGPCYNRGFHIGDVRLGGVRIFDTRIKIQHDAQWRASNYRSRPITDFLTRASKFCCRVTNVKTPIGCTLQVSTCIFH